MVDALELPLRFLWAAYEAEKVVVRRSLCQPGNDLKRCRAIHIFMEDDGI